MFPRPISVPKNASFSILVPKHVRFSIPKHYSIFQTPHHKLEPCKFAQASPLFPYYAMFPSTYFSLYIFSFLCTSSFTNIHVCSHFALPFTKTTTSLHTSEPPFFPLPFILSSAFWIPTANGFQYATPPCLAQVHATASRANLQTHTHLDIHPSSLVLPLTSSFNTLPSGSSLLSNANCHRISEYFPPKLSHSSSRQLPLRFPPNNSPNLQQAFPSINCSIALPTSLNSEPKWTCLASSVWDGLGYF